MKQHTADFKNGIKTMGRQIDAKILYGNIVLNAELYAVTPHFEANILKSVMKQLDVESSVDIPLNTIINCQIGILVNGDHEYLDYGNYVVYKSEKKEDTDTYLLTCYDKMLYSMKINEDLGITYPITIKNYLTAIASKLNLTLKNTSFANENMEIPGELYLGLEYTYRDILDEIAQATGSIIIINEDDEIEVKYPTHTNDTITEEFLKDVNINFGEKYGVINSIVLSRSGESDNVYLRDEESVAQNGLCEIKIKDNQIMNFNNRSDYLPEILNKLNGFYYYINDYISTGILYYDVGDIYNVEVRGQIYQCCMLNDEIEVKQGIKEWIYTEMPEQSETDYKKADKTDRRINQTYIIVDKQNQIIESVVSTETEQNQKIARITQTVDELNSKIGDIADITTSQESINARVTFTNINQSEPIRIEIRPRAVNISYLYPRANLYPEDILYMPDRRIKFTNTTTNEVIWYTLPADLLYYDANNYDEFILDYDSQTCVVNKKVEYNADGTTKLMTTPTTLEFEYPEILLTDGDYTITIPGYNNAYLFVRLMAQNIYTTQFATKAELNSKITQTVNSIDLSVNQKLTNYSTTSQMNSAINLKANEITSSVSEIYATKDTTNNLSSRIKQTAKTIELTTTDNNTSAGIQIKLKNEDGTQIDSASANITISGLVKFTDLSRSGATTINGSNITTGIIKSSNYVSGTSGTSINLSTGVIDTKNFKVNSSGNITSTGGTIGGFTIESNKLYNGKSTLTSSNSGVYIGTNGISLGEGSTFKVTSVGALTATNATITGNVTADSGTIGGFTIGNNKIYKTKSTLTSSSSGVYIGTDGISLGTGSTFKVTSAGALTATNATISGKITATEGVFENCTIRNTCSVPASTVSGTLGTSTIPNLSASKITSGVIAGDRLQGVDATLGKITVTGWLKSGGDVTAQNGFGCRGETGVAYYAGQEYITVPTSITVDSSGRITSQTWKRLKFVGGILTKIEDEW